MARYRKTRHYLGKQLNLQVRERIPDPRGILEDGIDQISNLRVDDDKDEFETDSDLSKWVNAGLVVEVAGLPPAEEPAEDSADGGDEEYDLSALDGSVKSLVAALEEIDDYDHVMALMEAEKSGKTRKGAVKAIQEALDLFE